MTNDTNIYFAAACHQWILDALLLIVMFTLEKQNIHKINKIDKKYKETLFRND